MLKKVDIELPDEFLKRWLLAVNKELTQEKIDEDYDKFKDDMKWQLIIDKIAKENEFKVDEEEVIAFAKESTLQQFRQYGMSYIPEEQLEGYAKEIISKPEERRKIVDRLTEDKAVNFIRESVKIDEKEVTLDEFNNMFK